MYLRVCWLLVVNLVVNISAKPVYSHHSQYGPGTFAEAESKPATSGHQPLKVFCRDVNGQGPCLKMPSTGGSNDPPLQAESSSWVTSQRSRVGFLQMADDSPDFASTLYSRPLISSSNLVPNVQSVVIDKNPEYDPGNPLIASYGSVYRLLKPHGAFSTSRSAPSVSFNPPSRSSIRSEPNDYKPGFSKISYDGTQLKDAYNSATHVSRKKPSLSSTVISSGPIVRFIMPNQSNELLEQTTNEAPMSGFSSDVSIKPVTVDQPISETSQPFKNNQGMIYRRPTSQLQAPRCLSPVDPTPQLRTTEPWLAEQGNTHIPADTTFNPFTVFKPGQITYLQQTTKPIQRSQQLVDSPHDVHDSSSTISPFSGSVYRFTRPGNVYGTDTFVNLPPSSAKTMQSNNSQAGRSFSKVGFGSSSSVVVPGDSMYGVGQPEKAYTSHSQLTSGNSKLLHNPYFKSRSGQSSYPMFNSLQPNISLPTWYMQMPFKSFNAPISHKLSVQNSRPDPVQDGDQRKYSQKPDSQSFMAFQSRPYTPENLFNLLARQTFPTERSLSSNQHQPGKSESANLANNNEMHSSSKLTHSYTTAVSQGNARSRSDSDRVSNKYVLDQSGDLVKPSQKMFRPLSSISSPERLSVSSENWHGLSQRDQGFALEGSRPLLNFQKVSFTRPLQTGQGLFSSSQDEHDFTRNNHQYLSYAQTMVKK